MAYRSFNQRFPAFKWLLLLAITLTLGLTVWSVQNVSTQTQQHAATAYTCGSNGGACYKYACPSGATLMSGTCGAMADSACCAMQPPTPTGLKSNSWYCKFGSPIVEYDTINFNWGATQYATNYTLYWRIYSTTNAYTYNAVSLSGYNNTTYLLNTKSLNGRHLQWYIKAANAYYSSKSSTYTTPTAFLSCG